MCLSFSPREGLARWAAASARSPAPRAKCRILSYLPVVDGCKYVRLPVYTYNIIYIYIYIYIHIHYIYVYILYTCLYIAICMCVYNMSNPSFLCLSPSAREHESRRGDRGRQRRVPSILLTISYHITLYYVVSYYLLHDVIWHSIV